MSYFKRFFILAIAVSISVAILDCSSKKNDDADASTLKDKQTPAANKATSSVKVFNIDAVKPAEKGKATDFRFTVNGKDVTFSEITKNKVVLLNFWATWCGPCRAELPDIIEISKELDGDKFIVVGIALERNPSAALSIVSNFAEKTGIPYYLFIGNNQITEAYGGIGSIPTTFIIDSNGNIAESLNGMMSKAAFLKSIHRVMKG